MNKGAIAAIIVGGIALSLISAFTVIAIVSASNVKKDTKEFAINETVSNIKIDVDTTDIEFQLSENNERKVVCEQTTKDIHEVSVENEELLIKYFNRRNVFERIFNFQQMKVTVFLPMASYSSLEIETDTGEIDVPYGYTFNSVKLKTDTGNISLKSSGVEQVSVRASTGNITLSNINTKDFSVQASTGRLNLSKINASTKFFSKTSTGNQVMEEVTTKELESQSSTGKISFFSSQIENKGSFSTDTGGVDLKDTTMGELYAKASTGNIKLTNTIINGHAELRTSTGDVIFEDSDAQTLYIKTSTGDIKGTFLTSKIFYVKQGSGSPNYPKSTEGGLCEIYTDTGNINIKFK